MSSLLRRSTLAAAAALVGAATASAATVYWDGASVTANAASGGGTGTWTAGASGWEDGATAVNWTNGDTAVFGGTAGTVTLGGAITANGLTFDTAGYTIAGSTLTLGGATPTITANQNVTITSIVAGSSGFTKAGDGTLTLSGKNSHTGPVVIDAGTLAIGIGTLSSWTSGTYVPTASTSVLATSAQTIAELNASNFASVRIAGGWISTPTNAAVQPDTFSNDGTTITFWAAFWDGNTFTKAVKLQVTKSGSDFVVQQTDARYIQDNIMGSPTFATQIVNGSQPPVGSSGYGVNNIAMVDAGDLGVSDMTLNGTSTLSLGSSSQVIGSLAGVSGTTVSGDGFLTVGSGGGAGLFSGVISGGLSIVKTGAGTQVFGGANTYTGATTVSAGTLRLANATGLGATAAGTAVSSGATLDLNGQAVGAESVSVIGTGVASAGALVSSTGNASLSGAVTLTGNSSVGGAGNLTLSGAIGGAYSLTKVGNGTLTLSVSNSYSGGTVISQGGITIGNAGSLGSEAVTLGDASTGSSNLSLLIGASANFARAVTVAANGTGTVTLGATGAFANPEFSGAITLNRDVTLTGGSNTDRMTFTGGISGTGNVTITGPGRVMFLNATNSFTGGLTIANGAILQLHWGGETSTVNYIPDASVLTANGILKIAKGNNSSETIGGLAGSGEVRSHEGVTNVTSGLVIDNAANHTFSGVLSNGGATGALLTLTKNGAGNQTLSGINTHTGGTTVNAGTLTLGHATNTLADTGAVTVAGGTLALGSNTDTIGALTLTSGSITGTGALSASSVSLQSGTVSGVLGGSGLVTKSGAGTVTLSGANVHSGGTSVTNGTLTVGNAFGLGSGAVDVSGGTLSLGTAVSTAGALTLTGGEIAGAGSLAAGSFALQSGNVSAVLAGSGSLDKTGAGTVTLAGANTYSGTTTVTNGTLSVTGSLHADSAVSVAAGATLAIGASGIIHGNVDLLSGGTMTLASGGSATGTLFLDSGAVLRGDGAAGAVTVFDGNARLVAGNAGSGTLTLDSLEFQGSATLAIAATGEYQFLPAFVVNGALVASGAPGAVSFSLPVGLIANGTYQLLAFGSTTATVADFSVTGPLIGSRQSGILSLDAVNGLLQYDVAGDSPIWTGANSSAFLGGDNWSLINGGNSTEFISGDALLLDDTAVATTVDISGADVDPAVLTFANETSAYTLQGTHGLSAGSIVKNGAGTLTIANANALDTLAVVAGKVILGAAGALGAGVATLSGGELDLNGQSTAADIVLDGGSLVGDGTVSGSITGTGALAKVSAGTLTLSGTSTFSGGTTVSAGVLELANATDTLADNGAVTVSGGELALGANDDTVGAVTVSGGSITGTGTLTGASFALSGGSVSAQLGGTGALTKSGAGTATLSGANTYSGGTTISNGILAVTDDAALGSGAVTLSGGTLALSGQTVANALVLSGGAIAGDGVLTGTLGGAGSLSKSGNGILFVTNAGSYNRSLAVGGGMLVVEGSLGAGAYAATSSVASGALLVFDNADTQAVSGQISGAGAVAKLGAGTLTLSGNNTFEGGLTVSEGTVNLTTSAGYDGVNSSAGRGDLTIAAGATVNADIYFSYGGLASSGNVKVVNVAGTLNLSGSEYARTYNLTAGTINAPVTSNDFLRSSADGLTLNSLAAASSSVITGNLDLTFASAVINTEDGAAADDLVISGNITQNRGAGSGAKTLVKNGAGRLVLSGTNAFLGNTTINAGTLAVTGAGGLFRGSYTGATLTVASGATLEVWNWGYNESTAALGGLSANASSLVVNGGTIRVTGSTPTSYGRGVTVNSLGATLEAGAGANWTIDAVNDSNPWAFNGDPELTLGGAGQGAIQKQLNLGAGSLAKVGEGTWTLTASNAFSGGTTVSGGTLVLGHAGALGSGDVTLLGGILDLSGLVITNPIRFSGGMVINIADEAPTITVTGAVSAQDINSLPGTEVSLGDDAVVDLDGVTKTVVISGAPTLANLVTFTGTMAVTGSLDLSSPANRPALATLELREGGTVDFGSAEYTGSVVYKGGAIQGAFAGDLNVSGANVAIDDGNISGGKVVVGAGSTADITAYSGSVRLVGSGAIAAGLPAFAGTLEVGDGAELNLTDVDGSSVLAGVLVDAGGVMSGVGSVGDTTVATGGILAPGNSPGTLTYTNLALLGGSVLDFEVLNTGLGGVYEVYGGDDYDAIVVTGELDLSGVSAGNRVILNLISLLDPTTAGDLQDLDPGVPFALDLISYGLLTGSEGSIEDYFTVDASQLTYGGLAIDPALLSLVDTGGVIQLQYAPIPEPSTYGLILGGLALAGAAIRRRRAKRA